MIAHPDFEKRAQEVVERYSLGHKRDTIRAFKEELLQAYREGMETMLVMVDGEIILGTKLSRQLIKAIRSESARLEEK